MKNIFDRLQLVKGLNPASDNGIFETREDAINYVIGKQVFERPSLVSEPIVLLYNNEEDPKEPNVILAIGSVGDGNTASNNNRTFFIDTKKNEEDIEELYELIEEAVKSLTLIPLESDTIKLTSEKTEDGTFLSGDVKIADYKIISGNVVDNIIETEGEKGIFTFVDMDYDPETFRITFKTTKQTKEFQLPPDQHVVEGRYSTDDEAIFLKLADDSEVKIDVVDLIDEWTVLPDSTTPVLLYKEHVSANSEAHDGVYDWQDVLTADVRVASHIPNNIIQKDATGRYLYVKGTADNIKYSDDVTVKEAIDRIDTNVSSSNGNLIYKRQDGIYAYAMLDYNMAENKLIYSYSDGVASGEVKTVEFKLNSIEILDDITYDPDREMIIIRYNTADGQHKTVEIPAKDIIEEWTVNNENHNVELTKVRDEGRGKDLLSADVKIHVGDNNILENKDHTLYVNGIADNIKYVATSDTTVKDAIDELKAEDSDISDALDSEITRSTDEDTKINNTIGNGFSTDSHETVTYKFETLQAQVNSEAEKLQSEIDRSKAKDTEHDGRLDTIDAEIGDGFGPRNTVRDEIDNLQNEIDAVSADSSSRLSDVINEDESIDVDTRDDTNGKPTIKVVKVNLSSEVEDAKPNIIKLNADGLYAGVDLSYVEEANKLIFNTTNGTKEIQLESMSSIISINYDPNKEAIIITYMTNGHEVKTVEIPVGDLIREWKPSENTDGAIKLTLTEVPSGSTGKDILYGEVLISDHEDNILVNDGGSLYVSNADITANTAAINALEDRMNTAEADIDALEDGLREEVSARTLADEALGARIDQEIEDRIADVNEEQSRAEAAELSLSGKIDTDILVEKNRAVSAETALQTTVNNEVTRATSEETRIETKLNNESDTARGNEARIEAKLDDEISRAQTTELDIRKDLTAETLRAQNADNELYQKIADEIADRRTGDGELREAITDEASRAQVVEGQLASGINAETDRATSEEARIETKLNNEITRSIAKDDALNEKVNSEITRATNAEATLDSKINTEERRASGEELALRTALTAEITRSTSAETKLQTADNVLTTNLANEVARATAAEAAIQTQVDANKLAFHDTTTIDLVRTEGNPDIVEGHVKIATSNNNIIRVDESSYGIYASVDLTYDSGTNVLTFKASDGTEKNIKLSSGSVIHRAWFDPDTEELVLEFVNPDGSFYEVKIPVGSLFNQWDVDNENSKGIKLIKTPGTGSGSTDLLSAEAKISQADDNILVLKDNHLYVSGSGVTKALADTETISGNLEALRSAVNGTSEGYTYPTHLTSHIISAATSYDEADKLLDEAFYNMIDKWFLLGFETCTTHTGVKEVAQNRHMFVDVRMSHGNKATGMTDEELSMTSMDDKYFSDTNVLRYINVEETRDHQHLYPDNGYNGMYLSNYWDCGKYYQESTESAEIDEMVDEGFEVYNDNYKTDEDGSASDYDYNNNVRQRQS